MWSKKSILLYSNFISEDLINLVQNKLLTHLVLGLVQLKPSTTVKETTIATAADMILYNNGDSSRLWEMIKRLKKIQPSLIITLRLEISSFLPHAILSEPVWKELMNDQLIDGLDFDLPKVKKVNLTELRHLINKRPSGCRLTISLYADSITNGTISLELLESFQLADALHLKFYDSRGCLVTGNSRSNPNYQLATRHFPPWLIDKLFIVLLLTPESGINFIPLPEVKPILTGCRFAGLGAWSTGKNFPATEDNLLEFNKLANGILSWKIFR